MCWNKLYFDMFCNINRFIPSVFTNILTIYHTSTLKMKTAVKYLYKSGFPRCLLAYLRLNIAGKKIKFKKYRRFFVSQFIQDYF